MHPIAIDRAGDMFVDLGSATNACQSQNRIAGMPGIDPCTELETRGGIWRYDANKLNQTFSPAERFATGLRNSEAVSFDSQGRMFAIQHGRDQLFQNWPKLYNAKQSADLPAEELVALRQGGDYGWPECYYDQHPEAACSGAGVWRRRRPQGRGLRPEAGTGRGLPGPLGAERHADLHREPVSVAYKDGAFIAFHGSWNRAPEPQGGYNVVFQPLKNGAASGPFVVFADGFAGEFMEPGRAAHRPTGLAVGPDGALYIADDKGGRIWRVTYDGDKAAKLASAAPVPVSAAAADERITARGHPSERGRHPVADPAQRFARSGGIGRSHLPRPGGRRHLCRLPWRGRQGLAGGLGPDQRQMGLERW